MEWEKVMWDGRDAAAGRLEAIVCSTWNQKKEKSPEQY
jgi:hypothetical protein